VTTTSGNISTTDTIGAVNEFASFPGVLIGDGSDQRA
jgi:hypothetical protein